MKGIGNLFIVFVVSFLYCCPATAVTKIEVTKRYDIDFPKGRCGGHANSGVCWTAPKSMDVDINGAAWKMRVNAAAYISLWVKGVKLIDEVQVYGTSKSPYRFARMIEDQKTGAGGVQDFAHVLIQQGEDTSRLQNISVKAGDQIYAQISGEDFVGLDLQIGKWDLAKDFSDEKNPNGPWSYGEVVVDGSGKPAINLFDTNVADFDPPDFQTGQTAWAGDSVNWHWSMMKSRGTIPAKPEIQYISGPAVYVESLVDGQWNGLQWSADYHQRWQYEFWYENAFQITINDELLATDWMFVSVDQEKTDTDAEHIVVELANQRIPINVKIHTILDGTSIITRWLELTNMSEKSMALNAIYPWTSKMYARSEYKLASPTAEVKWGPVDLDDSLYQESDANGVDRSFKLGYIVNKAYRPEGGHRTEGWFEWKTLTEGITEIGCDTGQCYDDPFFIIRNETRGQYLIGHLARSANWHMQLECQEHISFNSRWHDLLRFKIGPTSKSPLCVITPHETIKTPAVHMGYVTGDLDTTVQTMHEHIRNSVLPKRNKESAHLVQYTVPGDQGYLAPRFGDIRGCTEEGMLERVDVAAAIGAELFIVDAGWWDNQGDWIPSQSRFPRGLKPIVDYVHEKSMFFGLYGEIERAHPGSKVYTEHPDWIGPGNALKIGMPEVAAYVESELSKLIERYGIDLYRLDYNTGETMEGAETPKDGFIENNYWRYYSNFYDMMERIHAKYPNVILQQCAQGGARNDLGTAGRFHETYLTDGLRIPLALQLYSGQTLALPPEIFIILLGADGTIGVGSTENLDTHLRVTFTLGTPFIFEGMVAPSVAKLDPVVRSRYLHYAKIFKNFIRPILPISKVYHHAPVSSRGGVSSSAWFAQEYVSPERNKGWATIVRIGGGDSDVYLFKPKGLDMGKTYKVTIDSTGDKITVDGLTLIRDGLPVRLEDVGLSELLMFEEK